MVHHFGSWTKALLAAGLIKRAFDPAESVAERVQTAWQMRAGGSAICHAAKTDMGGGGVLRLR